MTLEDFEKSLAEDRGDDGRKKSDHWRGDGRKHRHHRHHRHEDGEHQRRHKRRRRPEERHEDDLEGLGPFTGGHLEDGSGKYRDKSTERDSAILDPVKDVRQSQASASTEHRKRDSWMEEPSGLDIDYTQKGVGKPSEPTKSMSSKVDFELKIHDNELNKHHLQDLAEGKDLPEDLSSGLSNHEAAYTFGDAGAQWRMTKLKAVYRRAKEESRSVEDIAVEQFGDLRTFDDAREEQTELDRRETYGEGYVGKEKPSGELFEERKLDVGIRNQRLRSEADDLENQEAPGVAEKAPSAAKTVNMDQTALNRLKAQMMKAKVRGSLNAAKLEADYSSAIAAFANRKEPEVLVLSTMENRMLAGGREGEVKSVENKRGQERGLVEENEDMSIEDMVREERRTRIQAGGDGRRFAERIAKDGKFDNDLDYMDENANKLAKRVQKSEISLKNTAISDFQKMNKILDNCQLCHHEDTGASPVAPVVSLGTRVYLTLPTEPEISDGGACIIPIQHHGNLLECDDDEWEEIRNFMKSLTRMYHDQGRDVIFYENAATPQRKKHAGMVVTPLPYSLGETAPAFFKEAILTADVEWTQHKKVIDTLSKAKNGLGKLAFRRTLVKEMPYFHVWFEIDGGLGHVVEDANRWPKGDLFAREVIGGMLDKAPDVIKRQGKWGNGSDTRVDGFRKRWRKFDWTRVLTDS